MGILFKYLFRNIIEKKLRSFLVFTSVALTSGLFFTSLAITDTIRSINLEINRSLVGRADIRILPKESETGEEFIVTKGVEEASLSTEYTIGMLEGRALYSPSDEKMIYAGVIGTTLKELRLHNPVIFHDIKEDITFEGRQIIISKVTADKFELSLGDVMKLEFGGQTEEFEVYGIAELRGLFMAEGATTTLIIPKTVLSDIYQLKDQVNSIYVKLEDTKQLQEALKKLQVQYPRCEVAEALNSSDLKQSMNEIELPLKLVTLFIIFMCIFIVFTSFKIISLERLPHIGTFRSVGATKRMSGNTLRFESLLYGLSGGIAGMGIGVAALWFITKIMASDVTMSQSMVPKFPPMYMLYTVLFAIALSYFSAALPIRGIFRVPTKNLILNQPYKEREQHIAVMVVALILLITAILIPRFIKNNPLLIIILDNTCVGFILIAFVLLLPTILRVFAPVLERLFSIFCKDGVLAAKNMKNNKSILNITGLLVIGVSTMIMISSINKSIIDEILNLYSGVAKYDIQLVYRNADQSFLEELRGMDGIQSVTGMIRSYNLEISDSEEIIKSVCGIDTENYLDFWNYDIRGDALTKLDSGRNIIMGSVILKKLGLIVGDEITFKIGDSFHTYHIIGGFDTLWDKGSIGLISDQNMMLDSNSENFNSVYVRTSRPAEEVQTLLQAKYLRDLLYNRTRSEIILANTEGVDRVFKILKSYTVLTMLIGIIGIINNLIVSFIERKRSFAVYRSIGMSKRQLKKMILLESIAGGLIGGGVGLLAAAIMLTIMPDVLEQMMGPMDMVYSLPIFLGCLLAAVIIMVVASVIPAMKTSKLSVIETIKYE